MDSDEQPPKARLDKIPTLKPAFREGGTVTAANSVRFPTAPPRWSLMRLSEAERRGLAPLAAIVGMLRSPTRRTCSPPRWSVR